MSRLVIIAAVWFCTLSMPTALTAQTRNDVPGASQENQSGYDVSNLDLNSTARGQLEATLAKKDYKQAEAILVEEAERKPKCLRSAHLLEFAGGIFFLDGQYENAAIAWKRAEAIAPLSERSRFTLAMAYVKLERRQWARSELGKLAVSQPRNGLYLYWLARLDYDSHKYTEAIGELQRVITLDPKMSRAYDLLGLCYDYLGRLDDAVSSFGRAVELNGSQASPSPWPHLDMAISQIELGQFAEAEANLHKAIGYDPRLSQARYQLGLVLYKEGKTEEAVTALKICSEIDLGYPEPHYLLGRIYHKLGKDELAQAEIEQFQQLKRRNAPRSGTATE